MATRPNPITTFIFVIASIVFWFIACWEWVHHNDHWALFWFAWCVGYGNAASVRLMRYRGAI